MKMIAKVLLLNCVSIIYAQIACMLLMCLVTNNQLLIRLQPMQSLVILASEVCYAQRDHYLD